MPVRNCVGLVLFSLTACSSPSPTAGTPTTAPPDDGARAASGGEAPAVLTLEQAIAHARRAEPEGIPIEVEYEDVDGRTLVEVELIQGDEVLELYFDPATSEIVRRKTEELDEEERAALPKLRQLLTEGTARLENALALARSQYSPEELREIELEMQGETLVLEIEIVRDGERRELIHNAKDGTLIGEESEDEPPGESVKTDGEEPQAGQAPPE